MSREDDLLAILRIGPLSLHGPGQTPLHKAIEEPRYRKLLGSFTSADLVPILRAHPELKQGWLEYSDSRRTDGWYVLDDGRVGLGSDPTKARQFGNLDEAVAHFVVEELQQGESYRGWLNWLVNWLRLGAVLAWGAVLLGVDKIKALAQRKGRTNNRAA